MGVYSNINVSSNKAKFNKLLSELDTKTTSLNNMRNSLEKNSNFGDADGIKPGTEALKKITDSNDINGSIKKAKKQIENILDGLDYITKYQEAEKKYNKAVASATSDDPNTTTKNYYKNQMESYKKKADYCFKK